MLAEVTGFALLAAVSPTALLVMAVFLSSDNPRRMALMYVAGAAGMTVAMAITVLLILRATHLNDARHHDPRYALRFALGLIALLTGMVLLIGRRRHARRGGGAASSKEKRPGLIGRMTAHPRPWTAFLAGVLLFSPSAMFVAAVQVVATANADVPITVAALVIVIVLTVLTAWAPLVAYLAAPDATTRALRNANGWLRAHSRTLVSGALTVGGVALVINGALGLWE